jgi:4-diphosphocytidyl-2-C-methyl-D-erythritol kinase
MTTFAIDAPAKINLHLEILGRREDGYHDIRSLFASVNLCDRLRLTPAGPGSGDRIRDLIPDVEDERNTIVRAVALFRRETGWTGNCAVSVEKRIPLGAGLGGGSSDAAATLLLCNRAAGFPLDDATLLRLGAEIGSDVPFFLKGACAVVEGRGERLFPVPPAAGCSVALLVPDFSVNTGEAYRWYDQLPLTPPRSGLSREEIVNAFSRAPVEEWNFFNSFSSVLFARYPLFAELRKRLRDGGAQLSGVSGSGSSYFGVFSDDGQARACIDKIKGPFRFAGVVEPLLEMPAVQEIS